MNEGSASDSPNASPRRALGWAGWLLLFLLLAVLALGGYAGWLGRQRMQAQDTRLNALNGELAQVNQRLDRFSTDLADRDRQLQQLRQRTDALENQLSRLVTDVRGGRERLQLGAVEQLLLLANDRAQLADDPVGAARALALADQRLADIADPQLLPLRKLLANERAQLAAIKPPDIAGATLQLQQLATQIDHLPLAEHAQPAASPAATPTVNTGVAKPAATAWWTRAWAAVRNALHSLFRVRRIEGNLQPVLTPAQAELVRSVLAARLAAAQIALQARDQARWQATLASAEDWLDAHFRGDDPAVAAARAELQRLAAMQLAPPLPDLSAGPRLLRARLNGEQ